RGARAPRRGGGGSGAAERDARVDRVRHARSARAGAARRGRAPHGGAPRAPPRPVCGGGGGRRWSRGRARGRGGGGTGGRADRVGEARAEQLGWLTALLFLFVATVVGVAHDLARAAAVRFRVRALRAVQLGLNTLRRAPVSVTFSWAWRALASIAPIAVGAL